MKKMVFSIAFLSISTSALAFDYKINLEGRADFVNSNTKSTTPAATPVTTTEKWNNFSNNVIRLNLMATINENLSYRFRYRFLALAATPATARELGAPTSNGVDFFYLDHKNSFFTTRLGKQNWAESAGRESFVSGTDTFLTSLAFANSKTGFGSDYRYGVTAIWKFMETNTFSVALSNPNATFSDTGGATAGPEKKNTGLALGAFYNGNFFNKLVQPVLGYTAAKQNGDTDVASSTTTKTKDVNYTLFTAGVRSEVAGATFDFDYKQFKKPNRNDGLNTTAGNKEQKTNSVYANVSYAMGEFAPVITYINDKYKTAETATAADANFKRNSFAVGTYWKPFSDVNFRYHLMYTSAVSKYEGTVATNAKTDDKKIYFGIKADI